jgi:hypothetical protein
MHSYLEVDKAEILLHGVVNGSADVGSGHNPVLREVRGCTENTG